MSSESKDAVTYRSKDRIATITIDPQGVSVDTPSKVKVQASQVEVTAGTVKVDAAMSTFSGVVKCDVLQATTVIAAQTASRRASPRRPHSENRS